MGLGGSNYEASDPGIGNVSVSQSAAREAARAATQYLGDDFMSELSGGGGGSAMTTGYTDALEQDKRKNNWEKMIAGIGSRGNGQAG